MYFAVQFRISLSSNFANILPIIKFNIKTNGPKGNDRSPESQQVKYDIKIFGKAYFSSKDQLFFQGQVIKYIFSGPSY